MLVIVVEMFMICLLSVILGNPDYVFHVIQLSNFNRIIFALGMKLINITIYLIARRKIRNINYKILGNPAYIVFVIVGFIVSLIMMSVVIDSLPTSQTKLRTMIAAAPILRHRASQRFRLASDISSGSSCFYFLRRDAREIK